MNNKQSSSNETIRINNVGSKLRRLKIEESILLQSIKKLDQKRNYEISESDTTNDIDCKNMIISLKDSYINIKNLFDEIKVVTSSHELLAEIDIDEIKKKVLELETTMRSLKVYFSTELSSLKSSEQEIIKQLEEIHFKDANIKKQCKTSASCTFKQVVPSPVGLLMTSPLKCSEVQEFQDFMKSSPNRYGGWNEYHHNIFVKLWQKHFGNIAATEYSKSLVENLALENFVEESLFKLQGIDKKNLESHVEWYKKYLYFKTKQQYAIDKWKSKKRPMKRVPDDKIEIDKSRQPLCVEMKKKLDLTKPIKKSISKEDIERVMAPTKQWLSRCEYVEKDEQIHFIENLEKLRIPNWRQYL